MAIPLHDGIGGLVTGYDALILDLWGVVYDGVAPYPGVLDCLAELGRADKRVIILSNAPRLAADADLLDGLDYRRTDTPEDADFLLVTGPTAESLRLDDYHGLLGRAAGLALPMVCANPDEAVIRGGAREPCAGAFAVRYAALGGAVGYQGKPYAGVYEMCFEALGDIERGRILAVGDGLATDIAGARDAGLDSLLVTDGLLADAWGVAPATDLSPIHVPVVMLVLAR